MDNPKRFPVFSSIFYAVKNLFSFPGSMKAFLLAVIAYSVVDYMDQRTMTSFQLKGAFWLILLAQSVLGYIYSGWLCLYDLKRNGNAGPDNDFISDIGSYIGRSLLIGILLAIPGSVLALLLGMYFNEFSKFANAEGLSAFSLFFCLSMMILFLLTGALYYRYVAAPFAEDKRTDVPLTLSKSARMPLRNYFSITTAIVLPFLAFIGTIIAIEVWDETYSLGFYKSALSSSVAVASCGILGLLQSQIYRFFDTKEPSW